MLWKKKSKSVREQDAVIKIQSMFRAKQASKMVNALRLAKMDREHTATLKIQLAWKRKCRMRWKHWKNKRSELIQLRSADNKKLSIKRKLRMFELRDELMVETKDVLNRKLLLRPNTSLAVYWKLLFATCLMCELANAGAQPWLFDTNEKMTKSNSSNLPGTLHELIARKLVPARVSELIECQNHMTKQQFLGLFWFIPRNKPMQEATVNRPWYCSEPYSSIQGSIRDIVALAFIPSPISQFPECQPATKSPEHKLNRQSELPWYCEYKMSHHIYRWLVNTFWNCVTVAVAIEYLLDVFITFFTGDFHPENGMLMPKPFFHRWIFPGLVLQLLVNPHMKGLSEWTCEMLCDLFQLGPVRVWRWVATVFFPVFYLLLIHIAMPAWLKLVEYENQMTNTISWF